MATLLSRLSRVLRGGAPPRDDADADYGIPDALWQPVIASHRFLASLSSWHQQRLRALSAAFLERKEFTGAGGLEVTDAMALAVAAQACLPLLHITATQSPAHALRWYDDFVGIVLQPGEVQAHRSRQDEAGVVHEWQEELAGESMEAGPVMLSWADVSQADATADEGFNVVIHEFAHKIDERDGVADGCPPLPPGFLGTSGAAQARECWRQRFGALYADFCEQVTAAERFSGLVQPPWLDAYGAESPVEFFAVASEAYWVAPTTLRREHAPLFELLDAFYGFGRSGAAR
jgi:Mlc titration factor MtfA (ptsG expression regulator)